MRASRTKLADADGAGFGLYRELVGVGDEAKADLPATGQLDIDLRK